MDKYQERYLEHIENKLKRKQIKNGYSTRAKDIFMEVLHNRKSVRRFNRNKITDDIFTLLDYAIEVTPSSCNRQGIYYKEVSPEYAEKVLVGGKNWVKNANRVFFLFGARECYKNPKEISYMPFLDGGFLGQTIYLLCELNSIGCCFVNPNMTDTAESEQFRIDNNDYFVGAIAVGDYDV